MGLKLSNGEFISFVDSDDYIEKNMYTILMKNIIKYDADLSIIGMRKVDIDGNSKNYVKLSKKLVLTQKQALNLFFKNESINFSMCDKLFKKEFISNIRLDETLKMCEDQKFVFNYLCSIQRIIVDPTICYNIFCSNNSLSRSQLSVYHFGMLDVNNYVIEKVKDNNQLYKKAVCYNLNTCISFFLSEMYK